MFDFEALQKELDETETYLRQNNPRSVVSSSLRGSTEVKEIDSPVFLLLFALLHS